MLSFRQFMESTMDPKKYSLDFKADRAVADVTVHHKGLFGKKEVGNARFMRDAGTNTWSAYGVNVDPEHRRKGLASAMYDHAKKHGLKIRPSDKQTEHGNKFWKGYDPSNAPSDGRDKLYGKKVNHPEHGPGVIDYVGPNHVHLRARSGRIVSMPRSEVE